MSTKVAKLPKNGRVAVLGAGISGLSYTYFLNKFRPDLKISIYEGTNRTGGYIKTDKIFDKSSNSFIEFEKGPRTLRGGSYGSALLLQISRSFQIEDQLEVIESNSESNRKYLLSPDRKILELPSTLKRSQAFLRSGMLSKVPMALIKEAFTAPRKEPQDESVEAFFKRRFGTTLFTDRFLSAVMRGVYAGDTSKLSVLTLFPSLVHLETLDGSLVRSALKRILGPKNQKKVEEPTWLKSYEEANPESTNLMSDYKLLKKFPMLRFRHGLQTFTDSITKHLEKQPGITFHLNSSVLAIDLAGNSVSTNEKTEHFDHIRSTLNSNALTHLVKDSELQELLKLGHVSIFLCNVYRKQKMLPEGVKGFGFLVPKITNNSENLLGVIFDSDVEKYSVPLFGQNDKIVNEDYEKLTFMIGGHLFDELDYIPSINTNVHCVKRILKDVFKCDVDSINFIDVDDKPDDLDLKPNDLLVSSTTIESCIPQFTVGYNQQKEKVRNLIHDKYGSSFSIGGTSFGDGVGVPDCLVNGLLGALAHK